jgi:hypothetical protein
MKTRFEKGAETTFFVIEELDPAFREEVLGLYYTPFEDGFAKQFPTNTQHLTHIYQRFSRYAEEMIMQSAGLRPVPWESAFTSFMDIMEGESIKWRLAGSVGLAIRGIDVTPRDIDLAVDNVGAQKLGKLLLDYLVEPVVPTTGWIANWFGRAFMQARVEWVGVDNPFDLEGLEELEWGGKAIQAPPLEMHLEEDKQRGLLERAGKIEKYLQNQTLS